MEKIHIDSRAVGKGEPAFFIAEIGSNHDGSIERAKELIAASREAGAEAVKFQSFTAEGLFNPYKADNGTWVPHPAYPVIERLTLPEEWHAQLKEYADTQGILFISAPFDSGRAALLDSIHVPAFKIASGDLTNEPLLKQVAHYQKPMIISTGAAYLGEVERAIHLIRSEGVKEIAVLHCASLYPPRFEHSNIRAMVTMSQAFGLPVGYSDHTPGWTVPLAAVSLGGSIIEKHITLSRELKGPDHPYALEPDEFKKMVEETRNLEKALGDGIKRPVEDEMGERFGARRSIYASADIPRGTVMKEEMLKLVRHASGLSPGEMETVIGKRSSRNIKSHELILWKDIEC